ncbi:MAG TPA: 4Fe-4S binding protein, partial [Chloroflexota bacterium]
MSQGIGERSQGTEDGARQSPRPWERGGSDSPVSTIRWVVWARRAVQSVTLLLFLYLVVSARQPLRSPIPVDLFIRLDTLAQLSSSLAAREWAPYFLWAVPLFLATAVVGRFFCGWLCPLGTTLDLLRLREVFRSRFTREKELRGVKYLLLVSILVAALAGSTALMFLDPLTLMTRSIGLALYPAFNVIVTGAAAALYQRGILPDQMVWVDTSLRGNLLPVDQPLFQLSWLFLTLFAAVVAANLVAHRFWCRYLCPLGAMLS